MKHGRLSEQRSGRVINVITIILKTVRLKLSLEPKGEDAKNKKLSYLRPQYSDILEKDVNQQ